MFGTVAHAVEEMHHPLRLVLRAPTQHAHHGRDANAAGNQHHWRVGLGIEMKAARGCPNLQGASGVHMLMKITGCSPRRKPRWLGWRQRPFDGDPVLIRRGTLGERIAANQLARRSALSREQQTEGQKLARLEGWQWQAVHRLQIKGALGLCRIFIGAARNSKGAKTIPSQKWSIDSLRLILRHQHRWPGRLSRQAICNTQQDLQAQKKNDVEKQCGCGHKFSLDRREMQ